MKQLTWVTATKDASLLGIGSQNGRFCVVDLRSGASTFFDAGSWVTRALWTHDGTRLLIGTDEGKLRVLSRNADAVIRTIDTGHGDGHSTVDRPNQSGHKTSSSLAPASSATAES